VILTRVLPAVEAPIDLDDPDARDRLADLYRPPTDPWLRLNLITSVSGSAIGSDGTSDTLTNSADRALLGVIRMLADVVLVGAASVRAEGYFVPRRAALAVVTAGGDLSGHRITMTGQRGPLLVLCPASASANVRRTLGAVEATIVELPDAGGVIAATDIVGALHADGYRSIVCEGGPNLAAHLVRAGVVDEACLSTSPLLNGSRVPLFGDADIESVPLELTQLLTDNASGLYARWLIGSRTL
jgi:riboflavin biosynthesis pyrimidine reductase